MKNLIVPDQELDQDAKDVCSHINLKEFDLNLFNKILCCMDCKCIKTNEQDIWVSPQTQN